MMWNDITDLIIMGQVHRGNTEVHQLHRWPDSNRFRVHRAFLSLHRTVSALGVMGHRDDDLSLGVPCFKIADRVGHLA